MFVFIYPNEPLDCSDWKGNLDSNVSGHPRNNFNRKPSRYSRKNVELTKENRFHIWDQQKILEHFGGPKRPLSERGVCVHDKKQFK
jgi:hypothetical protein